MQTRLSSLIESLWSIALGFFISLLVQQFIINPLWGLHTSPLDNIGIVLIFTVTSIIRQYFVRRYFNWKQHGKQANSRQP